MSAAVSRSHSSTGSPKLPQRQAYFPRTSSYRAPSPSEQVRKNADSILKLLSSLPAPLAPTLPPPRTPASGAFTPRDRTASPASSRSPSYTSFKAYARSLKRKSDDNEGLGLGPAIGLGLSVTNGSSPSPSRPPLKKARTSDVQPGSSGAATPPSRSSAHLASPKARSSLRNEIKRDRTTGTGEWTRDQWHNLHTGLSERALRLKRLGDAYLNPAAAKEPLRGKVIEDQLRGVLTLTDSLCMYLYRNFAEERMNAGAVAVKTYAQLEGLRGFIADRWQKTRNEEHREMISGMIGLLYLIEAVMQYHVSQSELRHLSKLGKELANTQPASSAGSNHGPSPASSTASPGGTARSPASSAHSEQQTADMLKLLNATAAASSTASHALLSSRHHLSVRVMRKAFPTAWDRAINSDLSDDLLPAPGDLLGCARMLDIDDPDTFAWPIELGMQNAVAHVAVFGRALVREFAQAAGKPWEVSAGAPSPLSS